MLKKLRVSISIILFVLLTFLFLDFRTVIPDEFHWLGHIQFVPAIIGGSFVVLAILIVLTLLFGRIYCSTICPMGIYQDIVSWFSKKAVKKKRYKFSKAKTILRWSVFAVVIVAFFLGFPVLFGLVEPYSAYGRIITNIFKPLYMSGNNILESIFTSFGNYTFYKVDVVIYSLASFIIALATFFAIGFLAWKYGRTYCNTICPVGTLLGFISKYSFYKIRIDDQKCNGCGLCAMKCKASCIDSKNHTVDYSRCVDCFNCLGTCNRNALSFAPYSKKKNPREEEKSSTDTNKRQFLSTAITTALTAPALLAQEKINDLIADNNIPTRQTPISPPGALSAEHLLHHCTSCHLCISRCPSQVIKPAFLEYGIGGMMQPVMTYEKGFCNYNCTVCGDVCPNRALVMLEMEEKHMTQIGRVHFVPDICVVVTDENNCGACAEHCPTQAVTMIPYEGHEGLTIPQITPDICVGCGGCEFICPVRPNRAIFVEGNEVHQQRKAFDVEEKEEVKIDDFGF